MTRTDDDLLILLREAADAFAEISVVYGEALARRNGLIQQAFDTALPRLEIARAVGLREAQMYTIARRERENN